MIWTTTYIPEALKDFDSLDGSQKNIVRKSIEKTVHNPLPRNEGGYGIPLGVKRERNLTGLLEIKMRGAGLRVVYKLVRTETEMLVIVIGMREDEDVFDVAKERMKKYNL